MPYHLSLFEYLKEWKDNAIVGIDIFYEKTKKFPNKEQTIAILFQTGISTIDDSPEIDSFYDILDAHIKLSTVFLK